MGGRGGAFNEGGVGENGRCLLVSQWEKKARGGATVAQPPLPPPTHGQTTV